MSEPLRALQQRLAAFAAARDWEQFHSPKNLAMALSVEVAELVEEFQWLTEEQSRALDAERRERVRLELADVFIYLLRMADTLDVDLLRAADDKIALNEQQVSGRARARRRAQVRRVRLSWLRRYCGRRRSSSSPRSSSSFKNGRASHGSLSIKPTVASPRCEPRVRTIGCV